MVQNDDNDLNVYNFLLTEAWTVSYKTRLPLYTSINAFNDLLTSLLNLLADWDVNFLATVTAFLLQKHELLWSAVWFSLCRHTRTLNMSSCFIILLFSHFSSIFLHFLPQFGPLGGRLTRPGRPWICYCLNDLVTSFTNFPSQLNVKHALKCIHALQLTFLFSHWLISKHSGVYWNVSCTPRTTPRLPMVLLVRAHACECHIDWSTFFAR